MGAHLYRRRRPGRWGHPNGLRHVSGELTGSRARFTHRDECAAHVASRRTCAKRRRRGLRATRSDGPTCLDGADGTDERPSAAPSRGDGGAFFCLLACGRAKNR